MAGAGRGRPSAERHRLVYQPEFGESISGGSQLLEVRLQLRAKRVVEVDEASAGVRHQTVLAEVADAAPQQLVPPPQPPAQLRTAVRDHAQHVARLTHVAGRHRRQACVRRRRRQPDDELREDAVGVEVVEVEVGDEDFGEESLDDAEARREASDDRLHRETLGEQTQHRQVKAVDDRRAPVELGAFAQRLDGLQGG